MINGDLYLNSENVSKKIRLPDVSDHVSTVAALTMVREFILKQIRQMPNKNGMVIDGRDIGTVVFPDADYKFFLQLDLKSGPNVVLKNSKLKVNKLPLRKF